LIIVIALFMARSFGDLAFNVKSIRGIGDI